MAHAVICGYARSPFTPAVKGALAKVRPDDLLAQVVKALLARVPLALEDIEDVQVGCAFPEGEQGLNLGRMASLLAGLPVTAGGVTVNRFCGSSMEAVHIAAGKIACGAGELFICAGVESMTRVPMGGFNPAPHPGLYAAMPGAYMSMGLTAERLAGKYMISRRAQEEFALASHRKAATAQTPEIVPVAHKGGVVEQDGCVRPDTTLEAMAALAPAFDVGGTVTAATSSPVTDGAAVLIVASEAYADKRGLPKLARIKSQAVAGVAPEIMGIGPVDAARKALARGGLALADIDVIELSEAFAVQALAVVEELGIDQAKLNADGGAIALGHPLGASGARLVGKAAQILHTRKQRYALAAMCIGGGQGIATVLEKV